jgi:hypothetical protein
MEQFTLKLMKHWLLVCSMPNPQSCHVSMFQCCSLTNGYAYGASARPSQLSTGLSLIRTPQPSITPPPKLCLPLQCHNLRRLLYNTPTSGALPGIIRPRVAERRPDWPAEALYRRLWDAAREARMRIHTCDHQQSAHRGRKMRKEPETCAAEKS